MKKLLLGRVLMVAVLTVAMGRLAMGVDVEITRATLKGIEGVYIAVEDFTEGEKMPDLTAELSRRMWS